MMKMKKRVAVVLLFALCLAQIPVAPKAKTKKVKLNLTKVSLLQGATVQLKLLNKKAGAVKWYSKNKKKQYKCKVTVKAPVKTANLKENNSVFTKTVYQKISKIQRLVVNQEVISPKGIYEIYQLLAAMDIQEITNSSETFAGGISLVLYFNDGTKLGFTIGKNLVLGGKQYKISEDVSEKVGQLLKQYKS